MAFLKMLAWSLRKYQLMKDKQKARLKDSTEIQQQNEIYNP